MKSIQKDMDSFRRQLRTGSIQKAYRALIGCMISLQTHFKNKYPRYSVSGLYQGHMDMTYFALFPPSLKRRNLKIAIVFNYEKFRFEAWLAGTNRQAQRKYWELVRDSRWTKYRIVAPAKGVDSIIEFDLAEDIDFGDFPSLTVNIEERTARFIDDVEKFFSGNEIGSRARTAP